MKDLQDLRTIANEALSGLEAGPALRARILARAAGNARPRKRAYRALALACAAVMLVAAASVTVPGLLRETPSLIHTRQAGTDALAGGKKTADVPAGGLSLTRGANTAGAGIWEAARGEAFPLICVDGRYFRMLTMPQTVAGGLLGDTLGVVGVYTDAPSLAGTEGVISNIVPAGEAVYAVSGMRGAMVAARVDGSLRAFQRVSFGTSALIGGETLRDTLCAESVVALSVSNIGAVSDAGEAARLMDVLCQSASYVRAGGAETGETLVIELGNGLLLQLAVGQDSVIGCGTFACPEFFEAFRSACQ